MTSAGKIDRGLAAVDGGLRRVVRTGELAGQAELHAARGRLLALRSADMASVGTAALREAETCFLQGATRPVDAGGDRAAGDSPRPAAARTGARGRRDGPAAQN